MHGRSIAVSLTIALIHSINNQQPTPNINTAQSHAMR